MKNPLTNQVGMLGNMFFMACSKLEAMAIYLGKQACGNDKLASVYVLRAYALIEPTFKF